MVVGGSRFYLRTLVEGLGCAPASNPEADAEVVRQMKARGTYAAKWVVQYFVLPFLEAIGLI